MMAAGSGKLDRKLRFVAALAAVLLGGVASPGLAAQSIVCTDHDSASVNLLRGQGVVAVPKRVDISIADRNWSTDPNAIGPRQMRIGQAFEDCSELLIDLADATAGDIVIKLRLFKAATTATSVVGGGTLWVKDVGAYALTCTGL
jgi:hypothetical protein